jgi:hypothetical protein
MPAIRVRQIWINLDDDLPKGILLRKIKVRIIDDGKATWLLPVYILKDFNVAQDGAVTVTLFDALEDSNVSEGISKALRTATIQHFLPAEPINNQTLIAFSLDLGEGNYLLPVNTATCFRANGKTDHTFTFRPDPELKSTVLKTTPERFTIDCIETFLGRFQTDDLEGTVRTSRESIATFKSQLSSNKAGKTATFLVAIGGGVDQSVAMQQAFRQRIQLDVKQRVGTSGNTELLNKIVDKLFENVKVTNDLHTKSDSDVVTFMLSNGVRITAAIGEIKKMDQSRLDSLEAKLAEDKEWNNKDKYDFDFGVKMEGGGYGFTASSDIKTKIGIETGRAGKISKDDAKKVVSDIKSAVEGTLPVAALSANQIQEMSTRSESSLEIVLGSFAKGEFAIANRLSLQELSNQKNGRLVALAQLKSQLKKRQELRDSVAKAQAELTAAFGEQSNSIGQVDTAQRSFPNTFERLEGLHAAMHGAAGLVGMLNHIRTVWGFNPPDPNERPRREADANNAMKAFNNAKPNVDAEFSKARDTARRAIDSLAGINNRLVSINSRIVDMQTQIDNIESELVKLLSK